MIKCDVICGQALENLVTFHLLSDSHASFSHEDHSLSFFFASFTPKSMSGSSFCFDLRAPEALAADVFGALDANVLSSTPL